MLIWSYYDNKISFNFLKIIYHLIFSFNTLTNKNLNLFSGNIKQSQMFSERCKSTFPPQFHLVEPNRLFPIQL